MAQETIDLLHRNTLITHPSGNRTPKIIRGDTLDTGIFGQFYHNQPDTIRRETLSSDTATFPDAAHEGTVGRWLTKLFSDHAAPVIEHLDKLTRHWKEGFPYAQCWPTLIQDNVLP